MLRTTVLCLLLVPVTGCKLLDTADDEGVEGRGATAFDPYLPNSGAIRLGLHFSNGCAVKPPGVPFARGTATFPYPDDCGPTPRYLVPEPATTDTPLQLMAGTNYFLNQFSITDWLMNVHNDPTDMESVITWMRTESNFRHLNWSGVSVVSDQYTPSEETFAPGYMNHQVFMGNAQWLNHVDQDTFTVEIFDSNGEEADATMVYSGTDLLASNTVSGHTRIGWEMNNIGAPQFPGDPTVHAPPPAPPYYPPAAPLTTRTFIRFELVGATDPKIFTIPADLRGDGYVKFTWSAMPDHPFYVPARFLARDEVAPSCFTPAGEPARCDFGLVPEVKMTPPANGEFYEPGEHFQAKLSIKDAQGNLIHHPDYFPPYKDFLSDNSNGLIYLNYATLITFGEKDTITGLKWAGPRQLFKNYYEVGGSPFTQSDADAFVPGARYGNGGVKTLFPVPLINGDLPGGHDVKSSTTFDFTIPADASAGTYNFYWKTHRYFMGERHSKLVVVPFQVGTAEETAYPGAVGNCQICHRGVLSLENLRHGMSVDHVEGCKACHTRDVIVAGRNNALNDFHKIHMGSSKYPLAKNDCTTCHLTRSSATRPSYIVCSSCHPQPHGTEFWDLANRSDNIPNDPSVYGNCAQACHADNVPQGHILPAQ